MHDRAAHLQLRQVRIRVEDALHRREWRFVRMRRRCIVVALSAEALAAE